MSEDKMFGAYLPKWQTIPGAVLTLNPLPTKQLFLDLPGVT